LALGQHVYSLLRAGKLALLFALVSRWNVWQANVPMFATTILSRGIVHNVCVSAVVRFRSRFLSNETKRGTKIKTYGVHFTAPLFLGLDLDRKSTKLPERKR